MLLAVALVGPASLAWGEEPAATAKKAGEAAEVAGQKAVKASRGAIDDLKRADPGLTRFFDGAAGYAVFPSVGKGAVGVGGAHGNGVLYEKGVAVGETKLTQVTVGLQVGAQAYTEVIFFETAKSLEDFKKGEFAMAAQVSAVAAKAGASANAGYVDGVSVFTHVKGGLMAEASVGGQKFSYRPFHK
jgi:lipid-binding SYLF domain-containing protein